jgi:hypothetical protein
MAENDMLRFQLRLQKELLLLGISLLALRCGRGKVTHAAVALGLFADAKTADGFIETEAANFFKLDPHARTVFSRVAAIKRRKMLETFQQALQECGQLPPPAPELAPEADAAADEGAVGEAASSERELALARLEHGIPSGKTEDGVATLYGFNKLADRMAARLSQNQNGGAGATTPVPSLPAVVPPRLFAPEAPATTLAATTLAADTVLTLPSWQNAYETQLTFGKHRGKQLGELLSHAARYYAAKEGDGDEKYLYWLARITRSGRRRGGMADYIYKGVNYSALARDILFNRNEVVEWRKEKEAAAAEAATTASASLPDFVKPANRKDALADYKPVFSRGQDGLVEGDPIANEGTRRMLGGICSALTGKRRKIVFKEGGGFATDMQGTIYLDPYPLGRDKPLAANLAVMTGGMEHELGHELFTNPDHWGTVLDAAQHEEAATRYGLDERGQQLITHIYNLIEDGRMERAVSTAYAGAAEHLALSCRLQPRWGEAVGDRVDTQHQVYGAMLYTALPYFKVRPEVREGMSVPARALFEELEPVVKRGVSGSQADALEASFAIARRLQAEGSFAPPPPDLDIRPPADPASTEYRKKGEDEGAASKSKSEEGGGGTSYDTSRGGQKTPEGSKKAEGEGGSGKRPGGQPGNQNARKDGSGGSASGQKNNDGDEEGSGSGSGKRPGGQPGNQNARKDGSGGAGAGADGENSEDNNAAGGGGGAGSKKGDEQDASGKAGAGGGGGGGKGDDGADDASNESSHEDDTGADGEDTYVDRETDVSSFSNTLERPKAEDTTEDTAKAGQPGHGAGPGSALTTPQEIEGDTDWEVSEEAMQRALDALERDAAYEIGQEVKRQAGGTSLGRRLHKPLSSDRTAKTAQHYYLDDKGSPRTAVVYMPYSEYIPSTVTDRRPIHKAKGHELAKYLRRVREQAEERLEMQNRGKLDRGRFVAAVKGNRDVYTQTRPGQKKTSLAVSINVDQSGSMSYFASKGQLLDAALTISDAMQELALPYEVRGFDDNTVLYKTMDDKELDLHRAAYLTRAPGGTERIDLAGGLAATSLAAREEANRLAIFMTDGAITGSERGVTNHEHAVNQMAAARKQGVIPFGIFFEGNMAAPEKELDELYGKGGWVSISSLDQMPKVVGEKIANIFNRLR